MCLDFVDDRFREGDEEPRKPDDDSRKFTSGIWSFHHFYALFFAFLSHSYASLLFKLHSWKNLLTWSWRWIEALCGQFPKRHFGSGQHSTQPQRTWYSFSLSRTFLFQKEDFNKWVTHHAQDECKSGFIFDKFTFESLKGGKVELISVSLNVWVSHASKSLLHVGPISEHFGKFGHIVSVDIQQAQRRAIVKYSSHHEALSALKSPEVCFLSRLSISLFLISICIPALSIPIFYVLVNLCHW